MGRGSTTWPSSAASSCPGPRAHRDGVPGGHRAGGCRAARQEVHARPPRQAGGDGDPARPGGTRQRRGQLQRRRQSRADAWFTGSGAAPRARQPRLPGDDRRRCRLRRARARRGHRRRMAHQRRLRQAAVLRAVPRVGLGLHRAVAGRGGHPLLVRARRGPDHPRSLRRLHHRRGSRRRGGATLPRRLGYGGGRGRSDQRHPPRRGGARGGAPS